MGPILRLVGDEESADRLYKIDRTPRARAAGGRIYGIPTLIDKLGRETVQRLVDWLELDGNSQTSDVRLSVNLRSAFDIVMKPVKASWLLRPYLEEYAIGVLTGSYGTFKSFLAVDWACHLAMGRHWYEDPRAEALEPRDVVYISAEGRGLSKRLRAWIAHHCPNQPADEVLRSMRFFAIEEAVNLSDPERVALFCAAIDSLKISPSLIVIDTLSRNSAAVEESNSSMATFLNAIDAGLRQRYHCTLLLIHHPGHENSRRARGPSNLIGDTDASFIVVREGKTYLVTLETERLKDSDVPQPLMLEAKEVSLQSADDEGQPETSLVLVHASGALPSRTRKALGKNQQSLLNALKRNAEQRTGASWSDADISKLAKEAGLDASRKREALDGLIRHGYLVQKDGVWLLTA
jgi:hypothetical protein